MLAKILEVKRQEVERLYLQKYSFKRTTTERALPHYPFVEALLQPNRSTALIAEVKKASPSKGLIRSDFNPVAIAQAYHSASADCLSVLTDQNFFQGDPSFIAQIKERVPLPILRKDFIIDPIQIEESVELGADAILLIAKALPISDLIKLYLQAEKQGLDVLIEIHEQGELEAILAAREIKPKLIGINNRNLATFTTSIEVSKRLRPFIPADIAVISESGIRTKEMVLELEQQGIHGFLIGEHFMRQDDIKVGVEQLYA